MAQLSLVARRGQPELEVVGIRSLQEALAYQSTCLQHFQSSQAIQPGKGCLPYQLLHRLGNLQPSVSFIGQEAFQVGTSFESLLQALNGRESRWFFQAAVLMQPIDALKQISRLICQQPPCPQGQVMQPPTHHAIHKSSPDSFLWLRGP